MEIGDGRAIRRKQMIVSIYVPKDESGLIDRLRRLAEKRGMPRSTLIREAIAGFLGPEETPKEE